MREIRQIYKKYKFLAIQPIKINAIVLAIVVLILISLLEFDAALNNIWSRFFTFWLIVNLIIIVVGIICIANMRESPKYAIKEDQHFNYVLSLKLTRQLQNILKVNVDRSKYAVSAQGLGQINNNLIRYFSFIVVFDKKAFLFIRCTQKIDAHRNKDVYDEIAQELSMMLHFRKTGYQDFVEQKYIGLGQYNTQWIKAMVFYI